MALCFPNPAAGLLLEPEGKVAGMVHSAGTQCPPKAGSCSPRLPSLPGGWGAQSRITVQLFQILALPLLPFEPSEPLFFQLWNGNLNSTCSIKVLWQDGRRLSSVLGT